MAVTEFYKSREMHITKESITLMQVFTCTAADWNAGGDGITALPIIGTPWSPYRPDLRVTDIRNFWLDNVNCRVEVIYSTIGLSHPENLADRYSSMRNIFDFSFTPFGGDEYWDYVSESWKNWKIVFATAYPGEEEVPPLPPPGTDLVWTVKMNLSRWDWPTISNTIGRVNDRDFLTQWVKISGAWIDITGDDTGHWLFTGFHSEPVGDENYEVTMMFLYSQYLWNKPYGVTTNMYQTANFLFLPQPDNTDDTIDYGLR